MNTETDTIELATELTIAWLSNPNTRTNAEDVPAFLQTMHDAVAQLGTAGEASQQSSADAEYFGKVSVRKSLDSPDHIISMIDGKPYRTLKRHLAGNGLTPAEYRARYNLKADYPMVAPTYSEARRTMAKSIGLGRKPGSGDTKKAEAGVTKPKRSGKTAPTAAKEASGGAE